MTYTLTTQSIDLIRAANDLFVGLACDGGNTVTFTRYTHMLGRTQVSESTLLPIPVTIAGNVDHEGCYAFVPLAPGEPTVASSIIEQLLPGDEIAFTFLPDGHANNYTRAAGLHVDTLRLCVKRDRTAFVFDVFSRTTPEHPSRMCREAVSKNLPAIDPVIVA